ncbi:hypothetical protein IFR05_013316 [Cadophora sp. M221]|nr:hypothetical protein IFR05_013316 [Cadophora sp. M221]
MKTQRITAPLIAMMAPMRISDNQANESATKDEAISNTAPNTAASNEIKPKEFLNIPPKIFRDVVENNPKHRKGAEKQMRQLGMIVHDFSCCRCGSMLDEAYICIECRADGTRILKWILQLPDKFEKVEEDDVSEYQKPENKKRKHQSQSVKFGFGGDPF